MILWFEDWLLQPRTMKLIEANCRRTCTQNKQVMLSTPRPIVLAWAHSAATWYSKLDGGGGGCNCNAVTVQCATVRVAPAYWALIPRLGCRSSCVTVSCCNALHGCTFHAASPPLHFVLSDACICFVHTAEHSAPNVQQRRVRLHATVFNCFPVMFPRASRVGGLMFLQKQSRKVFCTAENASSSATAQQQPMATSFCALPATLPPPFFSHVLRISSTVNIRAECSQLSSKPTTLRARPSQKTLSALWSMASKRAL